VWAQLEVRLPSGVRYSLQSGAPEEELAWAEWKLGFPLPESLRALLKLCNGQARMMSSA
jgi:hypothetical protein